MNRLLVLLCIAITAISAVARDFQYSHEGQTLWYTVIDESSLTCKTKDGQFNNIGGQKIAGNLRIPSVASDGVNNYKVVEIGDYSFMYAKNLKSVLIPTSVGIVGKYAFHDCSELTSINLTDSIQEIREAAFDGCKQLVSIEIPCSITSIARYAFSDTGLKYVKFPNTITEIGESAFSSCRLSTLDLPNSLIHIGESAFCSNPIVELIIPNSVTDICKRAFGANTNLTTVKMSDSLMNLGVEAFENCWNLSRIELPDGLEVINNGAFKYCSSLSSINIPKSLTRLGNEAFYGCVSLTGITMPDSITQIGSKAFYACNGLKEILIPNSVRAIGESAFFGCENLSKISLPNSPVEFGFKVFSHCPKLTSVVIPESIVTISEGLFEWCSNLTSVILPKSVKSIDNGAFKSCSNLSSIVIPDSVTYLGYDCVAGCALENIYVLGPTPTINQRLLGDYTKPILHVTNVDAFKKDKDWNQFTNIVALDKPFAMKDRQRYICGKAAESVKLTAPMLPENGNYAPIIWRSSNPEIVSIDHNGTATFHVDTDSTTVCAITADTYYGDNLSTKFDIVPNVSFSVEKMSYDADVMIPVRVSMDNHNLSVTSFQCDVHLPKGFEPLKDSEGYIDVSLTNRKGRTHVIDGNALADGRIRVAAYSTSNNAFKGTEGEIFTINIKAKSATIGTYPILIDSIIAIDNNLRQVECVKVSSEIVLTPSAAKGDVNADWVINIADAALTVDHILGNTNPVFIKSKADMNDDGEINITDVGLIITQVLGKKPTIARYVVAQKAATTNNGRLYIKDFYIKSNESLEMPIRLEAPRQYGAFQTDIYLPNNLDVEIVSEDGEEFLDIWINPSRASRSHILSSAKQSDGAIRVIAYSTQNALFKDGSDDILFYVKVKASDNFANTPQKVRFGNTIFNSGNDEYRFGPNETTINGNDDSSLSVLESEAEARYYNLQGLHVDNPTIGNVYIKVQNGKASKIIYID